MEMNSKGTFSPVEADFFNLIIHTLHTIKDLVYVVRVENEDFSYVFANKAGMRHLNCKDGVIIGKTFQEALPKENAENLTNIYLQVARNNEILRYEEEVTISGNKVIYESELTPIHVNGQSYIVAIVRDVTEKNQQLQEIQLTKYFLEKNEQRLAHLFEGNDDAVVLLSPKGIILEINPAIERLLGYSEYELIGLHIKELLENQEVDRLSKTLSSAFVGEKLSFDTAIFHKHGKKVYVHIKSIPIIVEGEITGIFLIAHDRTKEEEALAALSHTSANLESFLNDSLDAICITDLNGKINFHNYSFEKIFGFSRNELMNKKNPIIPDWLLDESIELYNKVLLGEQIQGIHVKRQKKSGELVDISLTLSPVYDHIGDIVGISSIIRDITETKKNEIEMQRIQEELKMVWDFTTDAIFTIDFDGNILQANPALYRMFLMDRNATSPLTLSEIYPEGQKSQIKEMIRMIIRDDSPIQFETKRRRMDGSLIDVRATYQRLKEEETLAVVIYKDITEEKRILNRLRESEERYKKVLEKSPDAMIIHDDKEITYINQAGIKLLRGKRADDIIGKPIFTLIHSDWLQVFIRRMNEEMINGESNQFFEMKLQTVDEKYIFVEASLGFLYVDGRKLVILVLRDVTAKRKGQNAVKESEERFMLIAKYSKDLIKIINKDGEITYASPSVKKTLGYPVRQVVGVPFMELVHSLDREQTEEIFRDIKNHKEIVDIEIRYNHLDGSPVWLRSRFIPTLSSEGKIEKFMIISGDITESKKKEEKLEKMAFYDFLTGLPNRRLFTERLNQAIINAERTGSLSALMILDCDHFKDVNDQLGHDVGDEVIKEFAMRIKGCIRQKDTLSRIGGDEFSVLIPEIYHVDEIKEIAKRILVETRKTMVVSGGHHIQLTTSIGVAIFPVDTKNKKQLFKIADVRLYQSKANGGNTFTI